MLPLTKGAAACVEPDEQPESMFSYISPEERVPQDHPLRAIRRITDRALKRVSPRFGALYVAVDSARAIAAGAVAASPLQHSQRAAADRATGVQGPVSLVRGSRHGRSGLGPDDVHQSRDRLRSGDIAQAYFEAVLIHADTARLLSDEHFTVDGTLLEAWGESEELPAA